MILMFDVFNEFSLIIINVDLFFDDNDAQLEKDKFEKNVINLIDIKNNNYFIAV